MATETTFNEVIEEARGQLTGYRDVVHAFRKDLTNMRGKHEELCVLLQVMRALLREESSKVLTLAAVALVDGSELPDKPCADCLSRHGHASV